MAARDHRKMPHVSFRSSFSWKSRRKWRRNLRHGYEHQYGIGFLMFDFNFRNWNSICKHSWVSSLMSHVSDKRRGCELYIKVALLGFIVAGAFECGNEPSASINCFWQADNFVASQEGPCSMELFGVSMCWQNSTHGCRVVPPQNGCAAPGAFNICIRNSTRLWNHVNGSDAKPFLFSDVKRRKLVVGYRCFGTTRWCYQSKPRDIAEEKA